MTEARSGFFEELKRRNVIRVALLYGVTAWMVFEVGAGLLPVFEVPEWVLRAVLLFMVLGFIPALVFSWAYEITPEGIRKESEVDRSASIARVTGRQIDRLTVGLLVVLIGIVALDRFGADEPPAPGEPSGESSVDSRADPDPELPAALPATTVAVLPFASRSTEEGTAIFADGIHDDLLTMLAGIGSLKIISRTSVMAYRDSAKNMRGIGQELGAGTILEGGVQQAGDNVRINVQLINALTDEHLWAKTYDRTLTTASIFAIQSEIAESITHQLAATLSPQELDRIRRNPTDSLDAYNAYIQGRQVRVRQTFEALGEGVRSFTRAVELDPDFVDARIDLARTLLQMALTGAIRVEDMQREGRTHIDRAIELDPGSGYAWAVLGAYQMVADEPDAEASFEKAQRLNPNNPDSLETLGEVLRRQGDYERALPIIERALALDPLSIMLRHDLGYVQLGLGDFEAADATFGQIEEMDPGNPRAAHGKASLTAMSGLVVEGAYWSDRSWAMDPVDFENPSSSAIFYFDAGYPEVAWERIQQALLLGPGESYPMSVLSYYQVLTGSPDQALATAREALVNQVDDRWGSHAIFLRVIRDAALRSGGDYGEALEWYRKLEPDLMGTEPEIIPVSIRKAADLGHLMVAAGRVDQGERLLEAVIEAYDRHDTRGSANFPLGVSKAAALAVLERPGEALAELQRAYDDGWRVLWHWELEANPSFDSIRNRPAFQDLISAIQADIASQRERFEARFGGPPAAVSRAPLVSDNTPKD